VSVRLRPFVGSDAADVLALNHRNVALLAPMDLEKLTALRAVAHRFDVVEVDGRFGGFVLTMAPGSAYWSPYYRWFAERGDGLLYLDRIVLHEEVRRRGVGSAVYDDVEAEAVAYGGVALEVNVDPPNEPSLAFHRNRGYVEVGRLGDAGHRVVLMEKREPRLAGG
jgi:predicted GNAT superfamily acetyltransferase